MGVGEKTVGVEVVKQPGTNDVPPAADATATGQAPFGQPAAGTTPPVANDPNELKPAPAADSNELTPTSTDQAPPPPTQVNEIQQGQSSSDAAKNNDDSTPASDAELSSSKKKKKGLKKIVPF